MTAFGIWMTEHREWSVDLCSVHMAECEGPIAELHFSDHLPGDAEPAHVRLCRSHLHRLAEMLQAWLGVSV